jgi:hypothetical protein
LCEGLRPSWVLSEFEVCHQCRPRVGIGHCSQACVHRWWSRDAGATLAYARRHTQGTRVAPVDWLGKHRNTGLTNRLRRPGMAHGALAGDALRYPLNQVAEHGANILVPRLHA